MRGWTARFARYCRRKTRSAATTRLSARAAGDRAALTRCRGGVFRPDTAAGHATQLLYRRGHNGKPKATATTVIVPADVAPGQTCPLLWYQCAIDAVTSRCFPSYALRRHAKAIGAVPQFDFLLVSAALAKGWRSRYPTTRSQRPVGRPYQPGYCVLDGSGPS